jgi:hypothetical protein
MEYAQAARFHRPGSTQRASHPARHTVRQHSIHRLQRTIGNQAVLRHLQSEMRITTGPDEKPKGETKKPPQKPDELVVEFEGGRKEKADLTKIKGDLWWFNGAVPRLFEAGKYMPQINLATGLPEGTFKWSITKGPDKVTFVENKAEKDSVTTASDSVIVRSKGPSRSHNDVNLRVEHTPKGAKKAKVYDNIPFQVRAPERLIPAKTTDSAKDAGFESRFEYTLKDNFGDPVPYLDYNEDFGAEVWDSASAKKTMTFPPRTKGSGLTDGAAILSDNFRMIASREEAAKVVPPITNPQSPLSKTKILHFWQKWYAGSFGTGMGVLVQTNTGQFYTDHGRHENIVSPPAAAATKKP